MIHKVSIHGGHSGQFCNHARNSLEEIIQAYITQGFTWVGISEHMPPTAESYLFAEEKEAQLSVVLMDKRFGAYISEARRLQHKYRDQIEIFVAFETEAYPGAMDKALALVHRYRPDYVLGSVHHVGDIAFDAGPDHYEQAMAACGGLEALYCRYFDLQYDMVQRIQPQVVGHFDLIRLFDPGYPRTLALPAVQERISRNLALIRQLDLILDYNTAALGKGAGEPYISHPILIQARDMGIAVVPSDDSHSVDSVGVHVEEGIRQLAALGFNTQWRCPLKHCNRDLP